MAELSVRKKFFDRLALRLSFHFNDQDMANILADYEGKFFEDSEKGISDRDICAASGTPADIVGNLLYERKGFAARAALLFRTTKFWTVILIMAQLIVELCLLRACNANAQTYTYCVLGINLAGFIAAVLIARKSAPERLRFGKGNIALVVAAAIILLVEAFVIPNIKFPHSSIYFRNAEYLLVLILACVSIYTVTRGNTVSGSHRYALSTVFHASGIIMVLLCLINQSGIFYGDAWISRMHLLGSGIVVYAETLILGTLLHFISAHRRDR